MSDNGLDVWDVDEAAFPEAGTGDEKAAFLLNYAVLAPSSHNSQPWKFRIGHGRIDVFADESRWLRVADADRRELHLSIGCAIENLIIAAQHFGYRPAVGFPAEASAETPVASVRLGATAGESEPERPPGLFDAIRKRHTNHGQYDGRPVPGGIRQFLESLTMEPGIRVRFTDDPGIRRPVDALTLRADAVQFADPAWREELAGWIGRGAFGHGWLISRIARFAVSHLDLSAATGKKDAALLDSASLLGLVTTDETDRTTRIRAGQVFERLFLAATDSGLALQPMNQILQVDETRRAFTALLPADWGSPQITFRLGYAEPESHTPRRPAEAVLL